jgi:hypothetical protein
MFTAIDDQILNHLHKHEHQVFVRDLERDLQADPLELERSLARLHDRRLIGRTDGGRLVWTFRRS